ncbi:MAG: malto-oligosyltrehalose trehalohydrolase [Magnetospirillum sp.]|nr:malto-oligosyltrehalose trehalohydrolase [Magnetospirillum sp.]
MIRAHAMPFGTEIRPDGVAFRLWAPDAGEVRLHVDGRGDLAMEALRHGWRHAFVPGLGPGARYGYRVGELLVPDPASRRQPDDVHGLSEVIDPAAYDWSDAAWRGRKWAEAVIVEIHVGTFTPEGSFRAAIARLDHLADLGATAIELMPVAEFPGARGWGYDGVLPFAPEASYGHPEDLKALVDAAHARNLMVLLDVVYNHFGPEGNYLHATARRFFTRRHHTPWGQAINYDGRGAKPVREFVIHNALYWLEEYHLDGLRLDAVHAIADDSRPGILEELAVRARAAIADREIHLVLENDANAARLLERDGAGFPRFYTAQWNDDLHHAAHRLLTGETGGYYRDYGPEPLPHLCRCLAEGFAYQGETSVHRGGAGRGEPSVHLPPAAFVSFLQNHDQIGNRALGERLDTLAPPAAVEAMLAVLLLAPAPPLLFMGEEWGASTPFAYFCDFGPELAQAVRTGRRREFAHVPQFQGANAAAIPDPVDPAAFTRSKLDWSEPDRPPFAARLALVRRLLTLRGRDIAPRLEGMTNGAAWCRVQPAGHLEARWRLGDGSLLALNANLSGNFLESVVLANGRILYSTQAGNGSSLPAWGVRWALDELGCAP